MTASLSTATRLAPRALVALVALSLGLKGLFLVMTDVPAPVQDAVGYLERARVIWETGTFGSSPGIRDVGNAPFYSIFLAPFVGLQGPVPVFVLAVQCVLAALVVTGAWWLGSRLGGRWGGWGAGLLCVTYPPLTAYPFLFLTETLAVVQFVAAMLLTDLLLVAAAQGGDSSGCTPRKPAVLAALLGGLMAVASLTRVAMFPMVLVPLVLLALRLRTDPRRAVRIVLAVLLAFAAAYGPWVLRNWNARDRVIVLNERWNPTRLDARLTAQFIREGMTFDDARFATGRERARLTAEGSANPLPGPSSPVFWRDVAQRLAIMLGIHPAVATPFPLTGHTTRDRPLVRLFTYAWHAGLCVLVLAAPVLVLRERHVRLFAALALPGALIAVYALTHGIPRYQIVPFTGLTIPAGVVLGVLTRAAWRLRSR